MAVKHILVSENEDSLQYSITLFLKQADFRVSAVKNCKEAVSSILTFKDTQEAIDLLIADLTSPQQVAKEELIRCIKKSGIRIPIIVLISSEDDGLTGELKEHGCTACISKPFEAETLMRNINSVFHH